jgi:hypothetical protein
VTILNHYRVISPSRVFESNKHSREQRSSAENETQSCSFEGEIEEKLLPEKLPHTPFVEGKKKNGTENINLKCIFHDKSEEV